MEILGADGCRKEADRAGRDGGDIRVFAAVVPELDKDGRAGRELTFLDLVGDVGRAEVVVVLSERVRGACSLDSSCEARLRSVVDGDEVFGL